MHLDADTKRFVGGGSRSVTMVQAVSDDVSVLWQRVARAPAQPSPWLALAQGYAMRSLNWQAGYSARQALRLDSSLAARLQSLDPGHGQGDSAGDASLGRQSLADAPLLATRFREALKEAPGDWLTWLYLARLQEMSASPDRGRALQQAQALEPIPGESLHWMGVWRLNAGDAQGAVEALSGLLDVRPMRYGSMMYLGDALLRIGNVAAAERAFARASLSNSPDFLLALSARVYGRNYWQEAVAVLRKVLSIKPDSVPAWLALAKIQSEVYALADCRESLRQVQALEPGHPEARLLDAGLQGRFGDAKSHLSILQSAYESGGDPRSRLASSIAMTSLYHDSLAPAEVADWHRRLCTPIEADLVQRARFANPRDPSRRLRVGFVTGDLHRQHPVNIFMLPVLQRFDHARFEICVYYTGGMHDEYTRQAQAAVDCWREVALLDDLALQESIVADGVDILIDLAGHTASHRLGVFALRAAPVQATFLGYPHSTGMSSIDWLIGDPTVSPQEQAGLFSERLAQLPGSVFCWAPVDAYPLPQARPIEAPVVFGSFNNAMKLSPRTIALWAKVLQAAPLATLLLKAPSFRDETVQAQFAQRFSEHAVAPSRLAFRGPSGLEAMMLEYGDIDIALDPLPYNGGTTTLQALWMGVPVITKLGGNFVSRMGASFMTALGRPDWVAADEAAYVEAAVGLVRDIGKVRSGRPRLREQMATSPLCDIDAYVTHMQALLRRMWLAYCENDPRRVIRAEREVEASCRASPC